MHDDPDTVPTDHGDIDTRPPRVPARRRVEENPLLVMLIIVAGCMLVWWLGSWWLSR